MEYIVKAGETISDVVMNATGNIINWASVLSANTALTSWTSDLTIGQVIIIPDTIQKQPNILFYLNQYPLCNNAEINDLSTQITELITTFEEI